MPFAISLLNVIYSDIFSVKNNEHFEGIHRTDAFDCVPNRNLVSSPLLRWNVRINKSDWKDSTMKAQNYMCMRNDEIPKKKVFSMMIFGECRRHFMGYCWQATRKIISITAQRYTKSIYKTSEEREKKTIWQHNKYDHKRRLFSAFFDAFYESSERKWQYRTFCYHRMTVNMRTQFHMHSSNSYTYI